MNYSKTGGPAFPSKREDTAKEGMTLRDYFAAKAMQGMFASGLLPQNETTDQQLAMAAYIVADAMLKAREA